jgi:arylsulfatase A-like enzyme
MLIVYFSAGGIVLRRGDWDTAKLENPVVSFARSVLVARQSPKLLTMRTSVGTEDFEPPVQPGLARSAIAQRSAGRVRNVVVVVLESVPAEYLPEYGGKYPVTPELDKYRRGSALFDNIYAHCPTTSYSLVSLLLSIYPRISYQGLTEEHPAVEFPSLSSELDRRGYRTAFFSSADLRHQQCDVFLSHRQFDKVDDYRSVPCGRPILRASTANWPFLDGRDDSCIADGFIDWIQSDETKPFFAVLWTMMTHYPYFAADGETDFGVPEKFNRYLNALRHDDRMLGTLLHALEERHLDQSTLVVVVGDHGEAFGQHGQWTHAQTLYEESVHVPLILINPELFHGERSPVVGGLIDVAPTVLEILGFEPPARWQGRSLWSTRRSNRVYFFAPWSDQLFGFRENDIKVIYNASTNRLEVYDLAVDPRETINRAPKMRGTVGPWQERLAAWVQYQNRMMHGILAAERP